MYQQNARGFVVFTRFDFFYFSPPLFFLQNTLIVETLLLNKSLSNKAL